MTRNKPDEPERTFSRTIYCMIGWVAGFLAPYGAFVLVTDGRDYLGHERMLLFLLGAVMASAGEAAARGLYDLVTELRRP